MKAKKLVLTVAACFLALCGILSENIQEVQAEETLPLQQTVYDVTVEVNSTDAFDQIKTSLLQSDLLIREGIDPTLVDFQNSDFILGQIDTTKISNQDINVLINIKPVSETTQLLIKSTITTKISLHVVDTQAPILALTKESVYSQLGNEFNPWDYLSYVFDNSNENVYETLEIQNGVDINTEGDYVVKYIAKDSTGNQTELPLNVKVGKRIVVNGGVASGDSIETMLTLINNVRAENGLNPLQLADAAGQTAIAIRAAESEYDISHRRPDGSHYKTALSDQGVSWCHSPLEILTSSGSTVEAKLNWWLNSPNHRAILMQANYDTIAIGYSGKMWAAIVY
ncbi:CAP domain-containing protein [Anaerorhabdus sp.]|uniref:CAP domain-containing protein n=1 Tax=Anaerorhabdus sp. TaxID=1872524 RepID=UPI002FC64802